MRPLAILPCLLLAAPLSMAAAPPAELPSIEGQPAVALVNGEPITLDQYRRALGELHAGAEPTSGAPSVAAKDPAALLERLINVRLMLQEAQTIGLDQLPEFTAAVEAFRTEALRQAVLEHAVRDVPAPDPAEVEKLYRERVQEMRGVSAQFRTVEPAAAFAEKVRAGADFRELAQQLLREGTAVAVEDTGWLARREMLPAVVDALDPIADGGVAGPVALGEQRFGVILVLERRWPEDAEARAAAQRQAASRRRSDALRAYVENLERTQSKLDQGVFDALDFDTDPAKFDSFLADDRVLVRMQHGEPIRVRDFTEVMKRRIFHGVERAGERKRLNRMKRNVLEEVLTERLLQDEGRRLGLDRTEEFQATLEEYRDTVLFGTFLRKVIEPSVKVEIDEIKTYYQAHVAEYTSPEMIRLGSISFVSAADAQRALERLNAGADLAWMRAHAEGQLDPAAIPADLQFDERLLTVTSLPEPVRRSLEGAATGQYRLHVVPEGPAHVLLVRDRVPARPQPLEEIQNAVAKRVFDEERNRELAAVTATLRAGSEVEVYASGDVLRSMLMKSAGGPPPGR